MDFVRRYLGTNEPLTSWTLLSSLSVHISTDLDKKWGQKCSTGQRFIFIEVTSYKIHTLAMSGSNKNKIQLGQSYSYIMRKVVYHRIWIQNYLGFIVSGQTSLSGVCRGFHASSVKNKNRFHCVKPSVGPN